MARNQVAAGNRSNPFPAILPMTAIVVAVGVASAASAAMAAGVTLLRLVSTVVCHVKITVAGTAAATTDTYLPAGAPEYFVCPEGAIVTVIRSAGDGSLFITPATKAT